MEKPLAKTEQAEHVEEPAADLVDGRTVVYDTTAPVPLKALLSPRRAQAQNTLRWLKRDLSEASNPSPMKAIEMQEQIVTASASETQATERPAVSLAAGTSQPPSPCSASMEPAAACSSLAGRISQLVARA